MALIDILTIVDRDTALLPADEAVPTAFRAVRLFCDAFEGEIDRFYVDWNAELVGKAWIIHAGRVRCDVTETAEIATVAGAFVRTDPVNTGGEPAALAFCAVINVNLAVVALETVIASASAVVDAISVIPAINSFTSCSDVTVLPSEIIVANAEMHFEITDAISVSRACLWTTRIKRALC